jgi:hypothetical protein
VVYTKGTVYTLHEKRKPGQTHCKECNKGLNMYQQYDTCSICRNDIKKHWDRMEQQVIDDALKEEEAAERMLKLRRARGVKKRALKKDT